MAFINDDGIAAAHVLHVLGKKTPSMRSRESRRRNLRTRLQTLKHVDSAIERPLSAGSRYDRFWPS